MYYIAVGPKLTTFICPKKTLLFESSDQEVFQYRISTGRFFPVPLPFCC